MFDEQQRLIVCNARYAEMYGLSAELTCPPLVKGRVYLIRCRGVRSAAGETLVHPAGAYTLNEIPGRAGP